MIFLVIDKQRFAYFSLLAPKSSNAVPQESARVFGPYGIIRSFVAVKT